jgi:L-alanine-DL-glutamate epimerase-like enolase superfamily enzyme
MPMKTPQQTEHVLDASHRAAPIARVKATPLNIPIEISIVGATRSTSLSVCLCEVETTDGLIGYGLTGITEEEVIAAIIDGIAAPAIVGEDALRHERIWDRLYWLLSPRGQTGYAAHAVAAIDLALWDIKGKALGEPVWRLLGGARDRVPVYTTFGFAFLDRDTLAAAAKHWVGQGHKRLKMTVGADALQKRDTPRPQADVIAEDARRIFAVRETIGNDVQCAHRQWWRMDLPQHASACRRRQWRAGRVSPAGRESLRANL